MFYFFASVPVHCVFRILGFVCGVFMPHVWQSTPSSGAIQTFVLTIPSFTFQTVLYLYLKVWHVQTDTLIGSGGESGSIDGYDDDSAYAYKPLFVISLRRAVLWVIAWFACFCVDITILLACDRTLHAYATEGFNALNYLVLGIGFFANGSKLYDAIIEAQYESHVYEDHVKRVMIIFGLACFARCFLGIAQLFFLPNYVVTSVAFMPAYYSFLELIPLAAAIVSIYRTKRAEGMDDAHVVANSSYSGSLGP
eukprot:PhF_6_TR11240/c0_g1_i2/m.18121